MSPFMSSVLVGDPNLPRASPSEGLAAALAGPAVDGAGADAAEAEDAGGDAAADNSPPEAREAMDPCEPEALFAPRLRRDPALCRLAPERWLLGLGGGAWTELTSQ